MYVAVKGGERAIDNAHAWLAEARRGDCAVQELSVTQIREQMALAVARVMAEGSLYDPDLAALAIKQARGDLVGRHCRALAPACRLRRRGWPAFGASRPPSRMRRAGRCWGRPSTTPTGCWILR
jgi:alpha-D-ribose 1-methylphosphonate 5-triphosphate synthase subunit PhnI